MSRHFERSVWLLKRGWIPGVHDGRGAPRKTMQRPRCETMRPELELGRVDQDGEERLRLRLGHSG